MIAAAKEAAACDVAAGKVCTFEGRESGERGKEMKETDFLASP
jgi:hypothetical protein